jgi:hypothetical protein
MVVVMLVLLGAAAPAGPTTAIAPELLKAAAARGAARVVVQLTVPEGAAAAAIEAAKQALWTDLGSTRYRVVRDLPGLPVVVLEASVEALGALAASRHVAHVAGDQVRRPQ